MADDRSDQIKKYAQQYAEEAIDALRDVMTDSDQKGAARAMAAKTMLERGFGAAERKIEQKVDVTVVDQRQAHFSALQKLAAKNNPVVMIEDKSVEDAEFEDVTEKGSKDAD